MGEFPNKNTQFSKERQPEKAGRPKGLRNRATLVKEWLAVNEYAKNHITNEKELLSQADLMTLAIIKKARNGDVNAFNSLMDSAFGKIKDVQDTNVSINKFDISKIYDPNETQTEVEPTGD